VLFLQNHEAGNYEVATFLGVPLIDEICQHFYRGKVFATKRGRRKGKGQLKPEIAIKTPGGPDVDPFHERFLNQFGSLQLDVDVARLGDEDYWNRHAILHGMMQRSMGRKDSAKCLMTIGFLFYALAEEASGASQEKVARQG
jgi:hypothetical protein